MGTKLTTIFFVCLFAAQTTNFAQNPALFSLNSSIDCDSISVDSVFEIYEHRCHYATGGLQSKYFTKSGVLNGDCVAFYKNGQVKSKCQFLNGAYIDSFITYYENGQIEQIGKYLDDSLNDCKNAMIDTLFRVHDISLIQQMQLPCNTYDIVLDMVLDFNCKSGIWSTFYPNGKLLVLSEYDNKGLRLQQHIYNSCGEEANILYSDGLIILEP